MSQSKILMKYGPSQLKTAVELVTKAVEEDHNRNYEKALRLYDDGIKYFQKSIRYEAQSERAQEAIRAKCSQYSERAEKIREALGKFKKKEKKKSVFYRIIHFCKDDEKSDSDTEEEDTKKIFQKVTSENVRAVQWSEVIGLDDAKEVLKETVMFPIRFPHLFSGRKVSSKGILLFGPPGTGKSCLARAVATEANNSNFFSVSTSMLVSKFVDESPKLIRHLFEVAQRRKPSIIFIDEIDSLCSFRPEDEAKSISRMKTELFVQMERLGDDTGVFVLGASNSPWILDTTIRRCFEECIYIPLPEELARAAMFKSNLGNTHSELTEEDISDLAKRTERYSGADISVVVRDALMQPVRKIQTATHFKKIRGPSPKDPNVIIDDLLTPCSPGDPDAIELSWMEVKNDKFAEPPVTMNDMMKSLTTVKIITVNPEDLVMLQKFEEIFGGEI